MNETDKNWGNTESFSCPVCNSFDIRTRYYNKKYEDLIDIKCILNICVDCNERGDFEALNDQAIYYAREKIKELKNKEKTS